MYDFKPVDPALWESRKRWMEEEYFKDAQAGTGSLMSNQAAALLPELQASFLAGAWASVIVNACTIVEGQFKDIAAPPGFKGKTETLFNQFASQDPTSLLSQKNLNWLRKRRNTLAHSDKKKPGLRAEQIYENGWESRTEMEAEATRAARIAFAALNAFVLHFDPDSVRIIKGDDQGGDL